MNVPHKIDETVVEGLAPYLAASSTTADGTQRKRLYVAVGRTSYRVTRRYLLVVTTFETTIYEGDDLSEAVRIYNGMG
jgi:hypothetical protein